MIDVFRRQCRVYIKRQAKFDFIAAVIVFLVAVPLCLGIALASGASLLSGLLSGIIGGVVVGSISRSPVSVSGPAAGMVAIVLSAATQLGGFDTFLLALMLAGILQIVIGALRAGFIADYVPSNIIQGLLCAIGILLILKELPLAFTLSSNVAELKMHLLDLSEGLEFQPLVDLSFHINSGAIIISFMSLIILSYSERTKVFWLKATYSPIVVVILGIFMNEYFIRTNSYLAQHNFQLVNIPPYRYLLEALLQLQHPAWSAWANHKVYLYAVLLAFIGSMETLLNIKAGEKLDKKHRICSKDRELVAQGCGNFISGLLGGLPITSVIIRTSVNIRAGARTKGATVIHGLLILIAIVIGPNLLNKIPLSSVAAILIYTGYKLTRPMLYVKIYKQGMDRFIPFIVTTIGIVAFNMLYGILLGLMVSIFFILKTNSQSRIDIIKEYYPKGITNRLILPQQITFLNKASLIAELNSIPNKSQLIIDARNADYIDKEIVQFIREFQHEQAPMKHISLNLIGFKDSYNIHNYIDFINVTTYDVQAHLLPAQVLNILKEGNQRFCDDTRIHRCRKTDIQHTAVVQYPIAVVLGCIDSRVPVETVFDMSLGDIFCARIAGNVISNDILASMEYACHVAGAKLIVVLGHSRCGAIAAACDGVQQGHITQLLAKIQPSIIAETSTTDNRCSDNFSFVHNVTELNIAYTLLQIYQNSSILRLMIDEQKIGMIGALYDISSGKVLFKDYSHMITYFDADTAIVLAEKLQKL